MNCNCRKRNSMWVMCSGRLVWIVEARMSYGAQSAPPLFSLVNQILLSGLVSHSCPCVDQKVSLILSWCSWVINEASPPFVRLAGKYSTQVFFFFFFPCTHRLFYSFTFNILPLKNVSILSGFACLCKFPFLWQPCLLPWFASRSLTAF